LSDNPLIFLKTAKEKVWKSFEFPWKKLGKAWNFLGKVWKSWESLGDDPARRVVAARPSVARRRRPS
jgi:hypothetical protein